MPRRPRQPRSPRPRPQREQVRQVFDPAKLADVCTLGDFSRYAPRIDLPGTDRFYHYVDNGSDVLGIAHLDSVQQDGTCTVVDTAAGLLAVSGTLDDRLGAYVILEMLPALGVTCDWLLTTDEEIGQSTADEFTTDKPYNWMFQFDRGGTDVVMYDYETPDLVKLVEACGASVGTGSYSDISALEHLGIAGFNWGVGYRDYHGPRAHAWLEDTFRMVDRFVKFHQVNASTPLAHEPDHRSGWWTDEVVADCGHYVDLGDPRTYHERVDGIDCYDCVGAFYNDLWDAAAAAVSDKKGA